MDSQLRLAFYDSSDGPRIMIFGSAEADFSSLKHLFESLARRHAMSCSLEREPFVKPFGNIAITLFSVGSFLDDSNNSHQGLQRLSSTGLDFEWKRTAEGWDYLAELIDGVIKSPRACHQYLTRYPDEDAIVVVSKGEYDDSVLQ